MFATGGFQGEVEVRFDAQEDLKIYRFGRRLIAIGCYKLGVFADPGCKS